MASAINRRTAVWPDQGLPPLQTGDQVYVGGLQPIAEYDNRFNYNVSSDIVDLDELLAKHAHRHNKGGPDEINLPDLEFEGDLYYGNTLIWDSTNMWVPEDVIEPHNHDDRYYTKNQSDSRFAPINHTHNFANPDHNHDDRYLQKYGGDIGYGDYEFQGEVEANRAQFNVGEGLRIIGFDQYFSDGGDARVLSMTDSGGANHPVGKVDGGLVVRSHSLDSGIASEVMTVRDTLTKPKNFHYLGYKIWHSGNDGPQSGLHADQVDNLHGSDIVYKTTAGQTGQTEIDIGNNPFILKDSTLPTTNIIWRNPSAGALYLGVDEAIPTLRSDFDGNQNALKNLSRVLYDTGKTGEKMHIGRSKSDVDAAMTFSGANVGIHASNPSTRFEVGTGSLFHGDMAIDGGVGALQIHDNDANQANIEFYADQANYSNKTAELGQLTPGNRTFILRNHTNSAISLDASGGVQVAQSSFSIEGGGANAYLGRGSGPHRLHFAGRGSDPGQRLSYYTTPQDLELENASGATTVRFENGGRTFFEGGSVHLDNSIDNNDSYDMVWLNKPSGNDFRIHLKQNPVTIQDENRTGHYAQFFSSDDADAHFQVNIDTQRFEVHELRNIEGGGTPLARGKPNASSKPGDVWYDPVQDRFEGMKANNNVVVLG